MVNQGFDILDDNGKKAGILYLTAIFRPVHIIPTTEDITNSFHDNLGAVTYLQ